MSGPPQQRYGAARLLVVLWAVAGCGAIQPPAEASGSQQYQDWLGALVSQAVKSATEPLFAQLSAGLDRINSKLGGLAIRVDNQDHKLDGLATRLNNRDTKLDNLSSKLDGLVVRLDNQDSRLSNQDAKLDGLDTGLSSLDSKLGGLVAGLSTQDSKLDALDTSLANLSTAVTTLTLPRDCSDLPAGSPSGVHLLRPGLNRPGPAVQAYCDMQNDGGRWTVIQRRADVQPRQNFYLGWTEYKQGFGDLEAEFWWGLDNMWAMTSVSDRRYELRINLGDWDGQKRYAVYQDFRVSSENDGYRLAASNYTGDAGDSFSYGVGYRFSTKDRDQDGATSENCAVNLKSGWWHKTCTQANLNGPNRPCSAGIQDCITWSHWKGYFHSQSVEMKIRPA